MTMIKAHLHSPWKARSTSPVQLHLDTWATGRPVREFRPVGRDRWTVCRTRIKTSVRQVYLYWSEAISITLLTVRRFTLNSSCFTFLHNLLTLMDVVGRSCCCCCCFCRCCCSCCYQTGLQGTHVLHITTCTQHDKISMYVFIKFSKILSV